MKKSTKWSIVIAIVLTVAIVVLSLLNIRIAQEVVARIILILGADIIYMLFKLIFFLFGKVYNKVSETAQNVSNHLNGNDKIFRIHIYNIIKGERTEEYRFDELPQKYAEHIVVDNEPDVYFNERIIAGESVVRFVTKENWGK